jgi:hypothetical protein
MDDLDRELDDVVLFELPTPEDVEAFCDRIRPRWEGWSDADEDVWLCTARLEKTGDLAPLLREVQELIAELGLDAIDFCLDGRAYRLDAARPPREADLAAKSK